MKIKIQASRLNGTRRVTNRPWVTYASHTKSMCPQCRLGIDRRGPHESRTHTKGICIWKSPNKFLTVMNLIPKIVSFPPALARRAMPWLRAVALNPPNFRPHQHGLDHHEAASNHVHNAASAACGARQKSELQGLRRHRLLVQESRQRELREWLPMEASGTHELPVEAGGAVPSRFATHVVAASWSRVFAPKQNRSCKWTGWTSKCYW